MKMSFVNNLSTISWINCTTLSTSSKTKTDMLLYIYYIQIFLCVISVVINSLMFCTVRSLRGQSNSIFLICISALVAVDILFCVMSASYFVIVNVFIIIALQNPWNTQLFSYSKYCVQLLRNYWIVCITALRMLKVCFPLKERTLVTKTSVK